MAKTDEQISDGKAKEALGGSRWPMRTNLWGKRVPLYKLLPKPKPYPEQGPYLHPCGCTGVPSNPDGLYVHFGDLEKESDLWYCDVIAIEHCGVGQNFWDKRARYRSLTAAMMLRVTRGALEVTGYGRGRGMRTLEAWLNGAPSKNWGEDGRSFPIRHLRTIYALPNDVYKNLKETQFPVPAGDLVIRHRDLLNTAPTANLKEVLKRLNPAQQWK